MEIILCPKEWTEERMLMHSFVEDEPEELVHGVDPFVPSGNLVLCSKEFADEYSLMHWRTKGSKNGERRYQYKNGSLTPEGYKHYAEMYGWGKFRADRNQAKSDKYAQKAEKAKVDMERQQVRADKAQVKNDRKGTEKTAAKSERENHRLNEARLRYDTYTMKANKYQNKADKIHDKWDEQTKKMEEKAQNYRTTESEDRFWRQKTEAEGKMFGEASSNYRKGEKDAAAKAEKLEAELARRGVLPKGSRIDENTPERQELARKAEETVRDTLDKLHKNGDMTDADYKRELKERGLSEKKTEADPDSDFEALESFLGVNKLSPEEDKAIEDRIENNRFVEGSKAFKENAEFVNNKIDQFEKLTPNMKKKVEKQIKSQMDEDLKHILTNEKDLDDLDAEHQEDAFIEYRRNLKALQKNFDQLSPEMRDYAAKAMTRVAAGDGDGVEGPFNKIRDSINLGGRLGQAAKPEYGANDSVEDWIIDRMDEKSGNLNSNYWKQGSRGEKAAKDYEDAYDKLEAREKEIMQKTGITDSDSTWNPDSKYYKEMQKALRNDSLYKAIKDNANKSVEAVVKAVAQDMGFPTTPEVLKVLEWYVWRD